MTALLCLLLLAPVPCDAQAGLMREWPVQQGVAVQALVGCAAPWGCR